MLHQPLGDFDFGMFLHRDSPDPARNFRHGKLFKVREVTNCQNLDSGRLDSERLSCSTESSETFALAKYWLHNCLKNHSRCNTSTEGAWYPTRLLDSGALHADGIPKIKLIETATTTIGGPYMTLSHSWGKGHSLTLNKSSYQMLLDGFTPSDFPQTFQEASSVARRLGVRYIWIDALCIFQDKDDLSDWHKEASMMHKVYAQSLCNIVAAETPDSSHSMFASRDPATMLPAFTEHAFHWSTVAHRGGADITRKYLFMDKNFNAEVEVARINTRAWVVQERFMSPRGLHFGNQQLFWECRETEAAETNPYSSITGIMGLKRKYEHVQDCPDKKDSGQECGPARGYSDFYRLVEAYSKCAKNLSFPSDKLIAFSAILKHFSAVHQEEIVAGMRRGCLEDDLLWRVPNQAGETEPSHYDTYIAPSWSWVSVRNCVIKHSDSSQSSIDCSLVHVEGYQLDYVTEDTTGAIRGGWLRLTGSLKQLKLFRGHDGSSDFFTWELAVEGVRTKGPGWHIHWDVCLDNPAEHSGQDADNDMLFCMPAKENSCATVMKTIEYLLLKVVNPGTGTFRRIGVANWNEGRDLDFLPANDRSESTPFGEREIPCVEYKDGSYSIYII